MNEMKPCPFCGEPEIEVDYIDSEVWISCSRCPAEMRCLPVEGREAWNTRPSPWRPIRYAPHDDTAVLVGRFKNGEPELLPEPGVWDEDYKKWFSCIRDTDLFPTHFMELPQLPEGER